MKLLDHIRHCQEIVDERGNIDVMVWHTKPDYEFPTIAHTMADEPSVSVIKHPSGGTACVAMIGQ